MGGLAGWLAGQEGAWQGIPKGDCKEQLLVLDLTLINWLGIGYKRNGQIQRARGAKDMFCLFSITGKVRPFWVLPGGKLWHVQRFFF